MLEKVYAYIDEHAHEYRDVLFALCRQPSVSAQNLGIAECAGMVRELLAGAGLQAEIIPTAGNPVVLAESTAPGRSRTLGFYNHYDVQPPEPLDLWTSDPFTPVERDGRWFARGIADNKGNIAARLCAIRAYQAVCGQLPVNLRWMIDGEEEVGSPSLAPFVAAHLERLRADGFIWESGARAADGTFTVYLGMKGMVYVELECQIDRPDLHSMYASVAPSPVWRLTWALSSLKGPDERVRIDGFYDDVIPPTAWDLEQVRRLAGSEEASLRAAGISRFLLDQSGEELIRRYIFAPSLNIAGIWGGYTGEGRKTIVPAVARAKVDIRLVPGQRPDRVLQLLRQHLDRHGFADVAVRELGAGRAAPRTNPDEPVVAAVVKAIEQAYGHRPLIYPFLPGTSPMDLLIGAGIPALSGPAVGHPESNIHAPNENIFRSDYIKTIKGIASLLHEFGDGA